MENLEFIGNSLDAEGRKSVPNLLVFKAFVLVEHKMPSRENLLENTLDFHRKFREDLGDIRVTPLVAENVRLA